MNEHSVTVFKEYYLIQEVSTSCYKLSNLDVIEHYYTLLMDSHTISISHLWSRYAGFDYCGFNLIYEQIVNDAHCYCPTPS